MAKKNATIEKPEEMSEEDQAELARMEAEELRNKHIAHLIEKLPASCSYDMDEGAIVGRTIQRLTKWGMTDDELGSSMKAIRASCAKHVAERTAARNKRAALKAARMGQSIEDALAKL